MKKIIALSLVIFTILCIFTACKNKETGIPEDIKVIDFDTTRPTEKPTKIRQNKDYKIKVSSYLVETESGGDVKRYASQFGYDIEENDDGSMTMKMDGRTYSLLLSTVAVRAMRSIGEVIDSGDYPYIVKLGDYKEDFSYILMLVNSDKYNKADKTPSYEELASIIGYCGLYYQGFTADEDNKCEVILADSKSGEIVYREVYTDLI